jgi:hypothetical protein
MFPRTCAQNNIQSSPPPGLPRLASASALDIIIFLKAISRASGGELRAGMERGKMSCKDFLIFSIFLFFPSSTTAHTHTHTPTHTPSRQIYAQRCARYVRLEQIEFRRKLKFTIQILLVRLARLVLLPPRLEPEIRDPCIRQPWL